MSDAESPDSDLEAQPDNTGVERVVDPDDYNTRRRLKQLHDAKERVKREKNRHLDNQANTNSRYWDPDLSRRNVAEVVADYVNELRPILARKGREDELLNEEIGDTDWGLRDLLRRKWFDDDVNPPSIRTSMRAWDLCNDYLEDIAGAKFEDNGLDRESGFTTVDE